MKAGDCPTPEQGTGNVKTFSKRALLRASAAPAILGASLIATAAFAQEAPQGAEAEATDTIVVTGSLIKNPNLERSTPVTATSADQIELKQNNTAEDILREIPGIVPSIGSAVNNGNGGASFVDLRGLGSNRNIVLLDGDRLALLLGEEQVRVGVTARSIVLPRAALEVQHGRRAHDATFSTAV